MKITITRKILLKPTPQQEKILKNTAQQYTNACNHISTYCQDNKTLSKKKIQENNYNTIRNKYNLPSQMAISTIRSVTSAYKTIHSDKNNKKFEIKPLFKKHKYDLGVIAFCIYTLIFGSVDFFQLNKSISAVAAIVLLMITIFLHYKPVNKG